MSGSTALPKRTLWDISQVISESSEGFPGDAPLRISWDVLATAEGGANVSHFSMSPHLGTHLDAPKHLDAQADDVSQIPLANLLGPCVVLFVEPYESNPRPITREELDVLKDFPGIARVLLKTRTVLPTYWSAAYRSVSADALAWLCERGITLLGLDTPGLDPAEDETLAGHHQLLEAGVYLLENLNLTSISEDGIYHLCALPLSIQGLEASPVRAILWRDA